MAEVEIGDTWMKLDEVEEEKEIPLIFLEDFNTSIKKFEQEGEFPPQQSDLTRQFQQHQQQIQLHNHQQLRLLQHQVEQPQPTHRGEQPQHQVAQPEPIELQPTGGATTTY
jgi:Tfp pilus assembly protein FimV